MEQLCLCQLSVCYWLSPEYTAGRHDCVYVNSQCVIDCHQNTPLGDDVCVCVNSTGPGDRRTTQHHYAIWQVSSGRLHAWHPPTDTALVCRSVSSLVCIIRSYCIIGKVSVISLILAILVSVNSCLVSLYQRPGQCHVITCLSHQVISSCLSWPVRQCPLSDSYTALVRPIETFLVKVLESVLVSLYYVQS